LIIAAAVSTGATPPFNALAKSVVHALALAEAALTHPFSTLATVFSVACGAVPFPAGVVVSAVPVA
jgi:hypothetical protein